MVSGTIPGSGSLRSVNEYLLNFLGASESGRYMKQRGEKQAWSATDQDMVQRRNSGPSEGSVPVKTRAGSPYSPEGP